MTRPVNINSDTAAFVCERCGDGGSARGSDNPVASTKVCHIYVRVAKKEKTQNKTKTTAQLKHIASDTKFMHALLDCLHIWLLLLLLYCTWGKLLYRDSVQKA